MADPTVQLGDALRDRYAFERELGRGGMTTVYLAQDHKHSRLVALKVLHAELATTLGPERFLREIKVPARLDHPHILPLLDSGADAGLLWYTMPYAEGETLRDRLRREILAWRGPSRATSTTGTYPSPPARRILRREGS